MKYGIVLDSILGNFYSNEREMLKQHIKNLKGHVDFKNTILILDRGYYSLELKLFLEKHGINYIFRLPKDTYGSEISQMESDDENIKIKNITSRRKNITDENILKKLKKIAYLPVRVVKIPIINEKGKEEKMILLTDLPKNKFNTYKIAGLYAERWEIEVNYDYVTNFVG